MTLPASNHAHKCMYVFQACRGGRTDEGHYYYLPTDGESTECLDAQPMDPKIPLRADIFVAYSTPPGFAAWREAGGSWFIQTLCDVLIKNADTADINSLMAITTANVALEKETQNEGMKQAPFIMSMLRFEFFLKQVWSCNQSCTTC